MASYNLSIDDANSTNTDDTVGFNLFYAIFLPTFCTTTVLGNLATIRAFWKLPELWERPSEALILSLACADFGTGLLVVPLWSPMYITPGYYPFGEGVCGIFIFLLDVQVNASLLTLLNISIDRFMMVYKEYPQYLKMQTKTRINVTIGISWSIAIFTGVVELSMWEFAKTRDYTAANIDYAKVCLSPARRWQTFSITLFMVFYFIPALMMCCFSGSFLYHLRKRLIKNRTEIPGSSVQRSAQNSGVNMENTSFSKPSTSAVIQQAVRKRRRQVRNRYVRPAITLMVLVVAMLVCILPYCCYVLVVECLCQRCTYQFDLFVGLLFLQFCNACLDPFLYAVTQRKIREYHVRTFKSLKSYVFPLYV